MRYGSLSKLGAAITGCAFLVNCAAVPQRVPAQESATKAAETCPLGKAMTQEETELYIQFYARLSHLRPHYGKPSFPAALQKIVDEKWPRTKMKEVSYLFYERVQNLVDRARLQNLVARTIGFEGEDWKGFDWVTHSIYVHRDTGHNLRYPLDKITEKLLRRLSNWKWKSATAAEEALRAEAILRVTDHYVQLQRWRAINGEIQDEAAAASAKTMMVLGIGLAGAGVIVGTTVLSGPLVAGAGTVGAGLSSNPAVAALLAKLSESAAAAVLGFVGAPATVATEGAYKTISEAYKKSLNEGTSYSCEISKEMKAWKEKAGDEMVSAALFGAGTGAVGGVLTFHPVAAKIVLYSAGFGVGVAQLYAAGKMGQKTLESMAFYRLAQEAADRGKDEEAKALLRKARDLAQAAGEQGLEAIIVGTLSAQMAISFKDALRNGESAIRQLWAASSDTVPSAVTTIQEALTGKASE